MLHAFRIGDVADANRGEELWAFIPPSHLSRLKHLVPTVTGSNNEHTYFNDGKALAKDIKVSATGTKADWKTMLLFGMGIGGKTYCALNITNPEEPLFMWEFSDPLQGYSEGKPIITRIADDGTGASFPAVIVPGGYDVAETAATTGNLTGKCFYVLHAETGAVIKTFKYGNTTDDTLSSPYIHTNTGFRYAFTAMAAVHDYNNDNVADYMYLTETGDFRGTAGQGARIWKVNLNGSPDNWQPTLIFQAPNFQTMFIPPTIGYDKYFRLWIMFGTGHRPQPDNSSNVTGQFYCFYDDGNISTPYTIADLSNITTYMQGTSDTAEVDLTTKKGLYFNYVNGNKEILFEPNPLFVNFKLFFNTYTPIVSAGPDPCADTGNEWVYILTLDFGLETLEVEEKEIFPGKMHGYGVLTGGDYVVYYGDGEAGGANMHSTRPKDRVDSKENKGLIFWVENFR
jgi:Tfp pilus tip-associated adhesin PilY1